MCLVHKDGKAVQWLRKEVVIRRISWSGVKEDIRRYEGGHRMVWRRTSDGVKEDMKWREGGHQMMWRRTWHGVKEDITWCEGGHDMVWRRTSDGVKEDVTWCEGGHHMVWRRTFDGVKDIRWCEGGHLLVWRTSVWSRTSDGVKDIIWCEGGHEIVWRGRCTQWTWECHEESRLTATQDWCQPNALSLLNHDFHISNKLLRQLKGRWEQGQPVLHNKGMTTLDTSPLTGPPLQACLSHLVLLVSRSALQFSHVVVCSYLV